MYKVYLVNEQALGAMVGYGSGETRKEAIEAALQLARQTDPNAYYLGGHVFFNGGVNR